MLLKSTSSALVGAILFLALLPGNVAAQAEQNIQFGGTYANLKPEQRRLVDELYRQYNEMTKHNLKSAEEYDELSLSVRTTFEAVTHALMTTKLTDQNGKSLGTALDVELQLVGYVVLHLGAMDDVVPERADA